MCLLILTKIICLVNKNVCFPPPIPAIIVAKNAEFRDTGWVLSHIICRKQWIWTFLVHQTTAWLGLVKRTERQPFRPPGVCFFTSHHIRHIQGSTFAFWFLWRAFTMSSTGQSPVPRSEYVTGHHNSMLTPSSLSWMTRVVYIAHIARNGYAVSKVFFFFSLRRYTRFKVAPISRWPWRTLWCGIRMWTCLDRYLSTWDATSYVTYRANDRRVAWRVWLLACTWMG